MDICLMLGGCFIAGCTKVFFWYLLTVVVAVALVIGFE
jgi:hypothetical protein